MSEIGRKFGTPLYSTVRDFCYLRPPTSYTSQSKWRAECTELKLN
jgi:hypothetical protein